MFKSTKILLLPVILILLSSGVLQAEPCINGDQDNDCKIDWNDLKILAIEWLNSYDYTDYAGLEGNWLKEARLEISEFMAINDDFLLDGHGQSPDWLEIHNSSNTTINLAGWYLTDNAENLTKWPLPDINMLPDEYLLIFASGQSVDNHIDPQGYYHTNFKLDGDGEYFGLVRPGGVVVHEYSPQFPAQTPNVSFGIETGQTEIPLVYENPTPGTVNTGGVTYVKAPTFSRTSCFYTDSSFSILLSSESDTADIHYTLNGTEPMVSSPTYSTTIPISDNQVVKAAVYEPGIGWSRTVTHRYVRLHSDVENFNSNLPLVIIDTQGAAIEHPVCNWPDISETNQLQTFASVIDVNATSGRAGITDSADFTGPAGLKVRGSSAACLPKLSFTFETWDEYNRDKDVSLLGMPEESDWILYAPYEDKPMMRNVLTYQWSKDMGHYVVRSRFVEVFINEGAGPVSLSDYVGVYVFMEKIKQGKDRVDIAKLGPLDNSEPQVTGGYIIKNDRLDPGDLGFTGAGQQLGYVEPKEAEITIPQATYIKNYLDEFKSVLDGPGFADPVNGYAKYIDVDSFIDYFITVDVTKNVDGFIASCFMYKDRGGKLTMGPVWDYNRAMGNATYNDGCSTSDWGIFRDSWWWPLLFLDDEFKLRYADRWYGLRENILHDDSISTDIDIYAALLDEAQARNYSVWPLERFWANCSDTLTYPGYNDWMKQWLADRAAWMDSQVAGEYAAFPPVFNQEGGEVVSGFNLTMSGGAIYYTTDGNDPRLGGGGLNGDAIEYIAPVTLNTTTRIKARIKDGSNWSAMNEATFIVEPVAANLRITEIMYHPEDTGNPNNPNEEFLELRNIGTDVLNLRWTHFIDGIDFTFPHVNLLPGQHIVVVKDLAAFTARYGSGPDVAGVYTGSLDNAGENIKLVDAIGQTIHDFTYSDDWQTHTDGDGFSLTIVDANSIDPKSWAEKNGWRGSAFAGGSPGSDDSAATHPPHTVVINEVMTHSDVYPNDWIELYNTTNHEVDISGWYLSDSNNDESALMKYRIADGTSLAPYGYVVFTQDDHFGSLSSDPGKMVAFALSQNGEAVYLSSELDQSGRLTGYREQEDFGASANGVTFGRYYKASTDTYNFVSMSSESPGSANAFPEVGPIVISEVMYHPILPEGSSYDADEYEYIELYNKSASSVTLYDLVEATAWKFTEGIDFTFPTLTPVTIDPGQYLVVARNPDAFSLRYPSVPADKIVGAYDGRLSNSGEKLELSRPGDFDGVERFYIRVDRVNYSDGSHPQDNPGGIDLWPTSADGYGDSLIRTNMSLYGNDPGNWNANTPTPGQ